ncbi:MAG: hypothetical protein HZA52_00285 [Planctomycetes bacterium]|nr:hypothetical protein [Planctomycetota bacterium]
MIARRSVWADEQVAELAAKFVSAADEVHHLQRGDDVECKLFQKLAEQGHYAGRTEPSDTRQGIYACTATGVLLASVNTNEPRRMRRMLERALERWQELPLEQRVVADLGEPVLKRLEARYPTDGLVLHQYSRDLEREPALRDWRANAWNQDFVWFTRVEARALAPATLEVGATTPWPSELARRLARCHLVDNVRGQVSAFRRGSVEKAELQSCVTSVADGRATLEFRGVSRATENGAWPVAGFKDRVAPGEQSRGFRAELAGRAVFELASQRFVEFELAAVGTRFGGSQFNGRDGDLEPAPMGVWFELASDAPAERVAPALVWEYGW